MEELGDDQGRTQRDLTGNLVVSTGMIWKLIKNEKVILSHSSAIKPLLRESDKQMWYLYAANPVDPTHMTFIPSLDKIHVDKKWLFITELNQRIYLTMKEKDKGYSQ